MYEVLPKNEASTIREAILRILSAGFTLTPNQLHNQTAKVLNKNFSYQAVYKCLKLLLEKRVLAKTGNRYSLSPEYIADFVETAEKLKLILHSASTDQAEQLENELKKQENQGQSTNFSLNKSKFDTEQKIIEPTQTKQNSSNTFTAA